MRLIKYLILTAVFGLALASCQNKYNNTFGDKDAFVAFNDTDYIIIVDENVGQVDVPIHLSSLEGLEADIAIEVIDLDEESDMVKAVEDVDFHLKETSFSFDKTVRVHTLHVGIIDNANVDGNRAFRLGIKVVNGDVKVLKENYIEIRIEDNDENVKP